MKQGTWYMAVLNIHINFNGNAEEAFIFYRSVFGGEFSRIVRFKDLAWLESSVAEEDKNKMMRISLPIGKGNTLSANDVPAYMGRVNEEEHRSKILILAETREEAERIYSGLSAGGAVEMPLADSPWGTYFGMFRDRYGIEWMIEYEGER